jgi:sialate O-acetylesterase
MHPMNNCQMNREIPTAKCAQKCAQSWQMLPIVRILKFWACGFFGVGLMLAQTSCLADVKLPTILSDHMVLQREMPLPIWGWADPGEEVTVTIDQQTHTTVADDEGNWRVTLDPLTVGEPRVLMVAGQNQLKVKDILAGEVWLCSGQSNMQFDVNPSFNSELAVASAKFPNIRLLTVNTPASQTPTRNVDGQWQLCSPQTVGTFSAVGYYFGRQLHQILDVPIGLIDNAWGGSACEAWIRRDRLENKPMYQPLMARWKKIEAEFDETTARAKYQQRLKKWKKKAAAAKQEGKNPPRRPGWRNPMTGNQRPGNLYHGRIMPVLPYALRGVIWYQGESNAGRAFQYRDMFPLMIQSWRTDWGRDGGKQGDFSFYWVQLADFMRERVEPGESAWAELREAQTMTMDKLDHTGEAVIIDIGDAADIHPRNKLEVANRLARWALAHDYQLDIVHESARYESMEVADGQVLLKFRDVGGRLQTLDAKEVQGFVIVGADKKWVLAQAKIVDADHIAVWSDTISQPVAVRYAWADNPICNVYNDRGLPLTPFRTDTWPGVTVDAR